MEYKHANKQLDYYGCCYKGISKYWQWTMGRGSQKSWEGFVEVKPDDTLIRHLLDDKIGVGVGVGVGVSCL